jgi:hypothetical protein
MSVSLKYAKFEQLSATGEVVNTSYGFIVLDDNCSDYRDWHDSFEGLVAEVNAKTVCRCVADLPEDSYFNSMMDAGGMFLNGEWVAVPDDLFDESDFAM